MEDVKEVVDKEVKEYDNFFTDYISSDNYLKKVNETNAKLFSSLFGNLLNDDEEYED